MEQSIFASIENNVKMGRELDEKGWTKMLSGP
jgi:hypothetical protein